MRLIDGAAGRKEEGERVSSRECVGIERATTLRLLSARSVLQDVTRNMNMNAGNDDDARPMSCVEDSAFNPRDRSAA